MKKTSCNGKYNVYSSVIEATTACSKDIRCLGVVDDQCKGIVLNSVLPLRSSSELLIGTLAHTG